MQSQNESFMLRHMNKRESATPSSTKWTESMIRILRVSSFRRYTVALFAIFAWIHPWQAATAQSTQSAPLSAAPIDINNASVSDSLAVDTDVRITGGATEDVMRRFEARVEEILAAANEYVMGMNSTLNLPPEQGTPFFKRLLDSAKLISTLPTINTLMLSTGENQFEVPGVYMQRLEGNAYEYDELVLTFNQNAVLQNVRVLPRQLNYSLILSQMLPPNDAERAKVREFLFEYSDAFNNKDTQYIRNVFNNNSLVISGTKRDTFLEMRRNTPDDYVARLTEIFNANQRIQLILDQEQIFRHPDFANVFASVSRQSWTTDNYSDFGYLLLVTDFRGPEPKVLVRFWQEDPFPMGQEVMSFGSGSNNLAFLQKALQDVPSRDSLSSNQGVLNIIAVTNDEDLLNADVMERWVREDIVASPGVRFDKESIVRVDDDHITVEFSRVVPGTEQYIDTDLVIRQTSLTDELSQPVRLFFQRDNIFNLRVFGEEETVVIPDPVIALGDVIVETDPDQVLFEVFDQEGFLVLRSSTSEAENFVPQGRGREKVYPGQSKLMMLAGDYAITFKKSGYAPQTKPLKVIAGEVARVQATLQPMSVADIPDDGRGPQVDIPSVPKQGALSGIEQDGLLYGPYSIGVSLGTYAPAFTYFSAQSFWSFPSMMSFALNADINLGKIVRLRLGGGLSTTSSTVDRGIYFGQEEVLSYRLMPFSIDLVPHYRINDISILLGAGIDLTSVNARYQSRSYDTKVKGGTMQPHGLFGLQYHLGESAIIELQGRYLTGDFTQSLQFNADADVFEEVVDLNGLQFSIGFRYKLARMLGAE